MLNYFKPLRRKIGVITLVMACAFAAGWVRSLKNWDSLHLTLRQLRNTVTSVDGKLGIFRRPVKMQESGLGWITLPTVSVFGTINGEPVPVDASTFFNVHQGGSEFLSRRQFFEFEYGTAKQVSFPAECVPFAFVPYWSIVIPMTLLSAWLLLSKPRTWTRR